MKETIVKFFDSIFIPMAIPADKANHAFYGLLTYVLVALYDPFISIVLITSIAVFKEIFDQYKYKGADGKDFLYTVAAPLLMYVIYYLN